MEAVVADLDGDLSVREVGPDEGRLDFNLGLFLGVQYVPGTKEEVKDEPAGVVLGCGEVVSKARVGKSSGQTRSNLTAEAWKTTKKCLWGSEALLERQGCETNDRYNNLGGAIFPCNYM